MKETENNLYATDPYSADEEAVLPEGQELEMEQEPEMELEPDTESGFGSGTPDLLAELRVQTDILQQTYELQKKAYVMLFITSGFVCYYIFRKISKSILFKMGGGRNVR